MKALSLLVGKLWPRLKFFKSRSNFKVKVTRSKNYGTMWKVLSQGIYICNMEALSLLVRKFWPRSKFFKSRSNFRVKVMRSKIMMWKVLSQGIRMWNMKALSLVVTKLWPRLKFLSTNHTLTPTLMRTRMRTRTVGLWNKLPGHTPLLAKNWINWSILDTIVPKLKKLIKN